MTSNVFGGTLSLTQSITAYINQKIIIVVYVMRTRAGCRYSSRITTRRRALPSDSCNINHSSISIQTARYAVCEFTTLFCPHQRICSGGNMFYGLPSVRCPLTPDFYVLSRGISLGTNIGHLTFQWCSVVAHLFKCVGLVLTRWRDVTNSALHRVTN